MRHFYCNTGGGVRTSHPLTQKANKPLQSETLLAPSLPSLSGQAMRGFHSPALWACVTDRPCCWQLSREVVDTELPCSLSPWAGKEAHCWSSLGKGRDDSVLTSTKFTAGAVLNAHLICNSQTAAARAMLSFSQGLPGTIIWFRLHTSARTRSLGHAYVRGV